MYSTETVIKMLFRGHENLIVQKRKDFIAVFPFDTESEGKDILDNMSYFDESVIVYYNSDILAPSQFIKNMTMEVNENGEENESCCNGDYCSF